MEENSEIIIIMCPGPISTEEVTGKEIAIRVVEDSNGTVTPWCNYFVFPDDDGTVRCRWLWDSHSRIKEGDLPFCRYYNPVEERK